MQVRTIKVLALILTVSICAASLAFDRISSAKNSKNSSKEGGSTTGRGNSTRPANSQIPSRTGPEWEIIRTLSPLPKVVPADTTNIFCNDEDAAVLGQKLFFEKDFSGPITVDDEEAHGSGLGAKGEVGKISCASCHQPESGWMFDIRSNTGVAQNPNATALGANWTARNVSSIVNTAYYSNWRENDGITDSAWADALTDPEDENSQNSSRLRVAHVISDKYRAEYNAVFASPPDHASDRLDPRLDPRHPHAADFPPTGKPNDPQWERMSGTDKGIINRIYANFGKAIEAYLRRCVSRNAPFDKYVAGDNDAISESAKRGLMLFIDNKRADCISCHSGPLFTNKQFYTTGLSVDTKLSPHAKPEETGRYDALAKVLSNKPGDTGEFNVDSEYSDDTRTGLFKGLSRSPADIGRWRTRSLRQVAATPPYMHTGQMATLMDVINFYDRGGDPTGTFVGTKDDLIHALNLTPQEKLDLVEFLKTLTGEPLPSYLTEDTSNH